MGTSPCFYHFNKDEQLLQLPVGSPCAQSPSKMGSLILIEKGGKKEVEELLPLLKVYPCSLIYMQTGFPRIMGPEHQPLGHGHTGCLIFNPIALRMAKTPWSFCHSEFNRVKRGEQ